MEFNSNRKKCVIAYEKYYNVIYMATFSAQLWSIFNSFIIRTNFEHTDHMGITICIEYVIANFTVCIFIATSQYTNLYWNCLSFWQCEEKKNTRQRIKFAKKLLWRNEDWLLVFSFDTSLIVYRSYNFSYESLLNFVCVQIWKFFT